MFSIWWFSVHSYFFPKLSAYFHHPPPSDNTQFLPLLTVTHSGWVYQVLYWNLGFQRPKMPKEASASAITVLPSNSFPLKTNIWLASLLLDVGLVKIFSQSVGCCFVLLTVSFALKKLPYHKDTHFTMSTAVLFSITRSWKQPRCPPTKRIDKENVVHLHNGILFSF